MYSLINGHFVRGAEGDNLLEGFTAVVPAAPGHKVLFGGRSPSQLSCRGRPIAHVLLGGLFTLAAMDNPQLSYINKSTFYLTAILGDFGFGAFIDEVGKFITDDNNYYF